MIFYKNISLLFVINLFTLLLLSFALSASEFVPAASANIIISESKRPIISISTNLPDKMNFSVSVADQFKYYGQTKATSQDGEIIIAEFGRPLPNGAYVLEIISVMEQPENVTRIIGENGKNLAGKYVDDIIGKAFVFKEEFLVSVEGGSNNPLANDVADELVRIKKHYKILIENRSSSTFWEPRFDSIRPGMNFDEWLEYAQNRNQSLSKDVAFALMSKYDVGWYWLARIGKEIYLTQGVGTEWSNEREEAFQKLYK